MRLLSRDEPTSLTCGKIKNLIVFIHKFYINNISSQSPLKIYLSVELGIVRMERNTPFKMGSFILGFGDDVKDGEAEFRVSNKSTGASRKSQWCHRNSNDTY